MSSADPFARSPCPVSSALDLIGDKWTLVLVRDMLMGKRRFQEFLVSPERIPTNVLAARLRSMEAHGLIVRTAYQARPLRYDYALTEKGRGLAPVLRALARWANHHVPGTWTPPPAFFDAEL